MTTNRREFIERLGATAMLGALPVSALHPFMNAAEPPVGPAEDWDLSWTAALKGKKHKAIFDNTEVESGYGVWRSSIWENQYHEVMKAKPAETKTVLVLRHNAVVLGFKQELWDQAGIGPDAKVTHPITQQGTDRNPALLSARRNEVPEMFDAFALPNFISRGGIVLACNLALQFWSGAWAQKAKMTPEEAYAKARAAFIPGVIVQPSGVFAAVRAQEEGCQYVRAS
jgi:hypothetical protein